MTSSSQLTVPNFSTPILIVPRSAAWAAMVMTRPPTRLTPKANRPSHPSLPPCRAFLLRPPACSCRRLRAASPLAPACCRPASGAGRRSARMWWRILPVGRDARCRQSVRGGAGEDAGHRALQRGQEGGGHGGTRGGGAQGGQAARGRDGAAGGAQGGRGDGRDPRHRDLPHRRVHALGRRSGGAVPGDPRPRGGGRRGRGRAGRELGQEGRPRHPALHARMPRVRVLPVAARPISARRSARPRARA